MIRLLGFLTALLTFPGRILRVLLCQLFCYSAGVPIITVKYFQFKGPYGFVLHDPSSRPVANFIIATISFLIQTLLGILIMIPATIEVFVFESYQNPMNFLMLYLGLSFLINDFPDYFDAKGMWQSIYQNAQDVNIFTRIVLFPLLAVVYAGSLHRGYLQPFALAYGLLMMYCLPHIIGVLL